MYSYPTRVRARARARGRGDIPRAANYHPKRTYYQPARTCLFSTADVDTLRSCADKRTDKMATFFVWRTGAVMYMYIYVYAADRTGSCRKPWGSGANAGIILGSYRAVSYRVVSYRIVSYRIVSFRCVSLRIVAVIAGSE